MDNVDISVVIPVFNKSMCIERLLTSIFSQTHKPCEIIIVDDGSTDASIQKIYDSLYFKSETIKIVSQKNFGVAVARNRGISMASSKYVALLDADDEWLPSHISDICKLISMYPDRIAYSCSHFFRTSECMQGVLKGVVSQDEFLLVKNFLQTASKIPILNCSTVVLNRQLIKSVNFFPEGVKVGEDLFAWFTNIGQSEIGYTNNCGVIVHQEDDKNRNRRQSLPSHLIKHFSQNKRNFDNIEYGYLWRIWLSHFYGSIVNKQRRLSLQYLKYGTDIFGVKVIIFGVLLLVPLNLIKVLGGFYKKYAQ